MSTFRRNSDFPFQKLEEETIVVDPKRREVHLLNDTASHVWDLLASPRSLDELCAAVGDAYDASPDEVREGVSELLRGLEDKGLLRAA